MTSKVLLIDDSRQIHDLVRARLAGEPVSLYFATGGTEGLATARQIGLDLILLDTEMPGIDGFDVCRQLKNDPATADIPILFLAGASSSREKILGLECGAVDFVPKPFDAIELRARVRCALRVKYLMDLLSTRAQIDGLTGLWNLQHFQDRLGQEMSLSRRTGQPVCGIKIGIDGFKAIREAHGFPFSDELLREVTAALGRAARTQDILCRVATNEFALVCPNTTLEGGNALAARCLAAISSLALRHGDKPVEITCRFAVVGELLETQAMLDAIEAAMVSSQNGHGNRIIASDEPMIAMAG